MQVTDKLIDKFFNNGCTEGEANAVAAYLAANPDQLPPRLKADWEAAGNAMPLPVADRRQMLAAIRKTTQAGRGARYRVYRIVMAAAAVLLLVAGSAWWFSEASSEKKITQHNTGPQPPEEKILVKMNTAGKPLEITLPDGSRAILSAGASVRYPAFFTANAREIQLDGTAFFNVKKDSGRPFTVYASGIATTAIGTRFRVSGSAKGVSVKLYTGKVVIDKISKTGPGWKGPVYLLPGTMMEFSGASGKAEISVFARDKKQSQPFAAEKNSNGRVTTSMEFDNTPLNEVFERLKEKYHQHIVYERTMVSRHYFTGKVLTTDSLDVLLKVIGQMNSLVITKEPGGFLIAKQ